MPRLLLLETATEICSVGLWEGDALIMEANANENYQHTSALTVMIEGAMAKAGWQMSQLDGVAVSSGPGSYTALRVGAATAKGICFAGDIPLIAVDTLDSLASAIHEQLLILPSSDVHIMPMIDARRMEVYSALYSTTLDQLLAPSAVIVDEKKLAALKSGKDALYIGGNGAEKCRPLLEQDMKIVDVQCAAEHLGPIAKRKFDSQEFEDIAYFSPNYLKPPNITTPKPLWN